MQVCVHRYESKGLCVGMVGVVMGRVLKREG